MACYVTVQLFQGKQVLRFCERWWAHMLNLAQVHGWRPGKADSPDDTFSLPSGSPVFREDGLDLETARPAERKCFDSRVVGPADAARLGQALLHAYRALSPDDLLGRAMCKAAVTALRRTGGTDDAEVTVDPHSLDVELAVFFSGPNRRLVKQVERFCRRGGFTLICPSGSAAGHVRGEAELASGMANERDQAASALTHKSLQSGVGRP